MPQSLAVELHGAVDSFLGTAEGSYEHRRSSRRLDRAVHALASRLQGDDHVDPALVQPLQECCVVILTKATSELPESTLVSSCFILQTHLDYPLLQPEQLDALVDKAASLFLGRRHGGTGSSTSTGTSGTSTGTGTSSSKSPEYSAVGIALLHVVNQQLERLEDQAAAAAAANDAPPTSLLLLSGLETIQLLLLMLPLVLQELSIRWTQTPSFEEGDLDLAQRTFVMFLLKHMGTLISTTTTAISQQQETNGVVLQVWLQHQFLSTENSVLPSNNINKNNISNPALLVRPEIDSFLRLLQTFGDEMVEYSLDMMEQNGGNIRDAIRHVSLASTVVKVLREEVGVPLCHSTVSSLLTTLAAFVANMPLLEATADKNTKDTACQLLVHLACSTDSSLDITSPDHPQIEQALCMAILSALGTIGIDAPNVQQLWMRLNQSKTATRTLQAAAMASMVFMPNVVVPPIMDGMPKNDPWHSLLARKCSDRSAMTGTK
jgi:hypothetical protein